MNLTLTACGGGGGGTEPAAIHPNDASDVLNHSVFGALGIGSC
ncbi:hypothetical protein [uncultured Planktomarina sp.]